MEMLPCPFCGGEPSVSEGRSGDNQTLYYVECVDCEGMAGMESDRVDAVYKWNLRVIACGDEYGLSVIQLGRMADETGDTRIAEDREFSEFRLHCGLASGHSGHHYGVGTVGGYKVKADWPK